MDCSGRGVGCISTSAGSSLGQILTGSSLGQPSFEGGQLGGCTDESEPMGDHIMRGEGLVPKLGKSEGFSVIVVNLIKLYFFALFV